MKKILIYLIALFNCVCISAQKASDTVADTLTIVADSVELQVDSAVSTMLDSISALDYGEYNDTVTSGPQLDFHAVDSAFLSGQKVEFTSKRWIPDPKKAMWLAIVFPGGGQIYNRKYWKLPLIYGGFIGCAYALSWNGSMYRDYSQAFMDIMDNDPNTKSYENFLPASYDVNSRLEYFQNLFKRKKDYFRRYRDLSLFCMIGVYLLSIVDAYVDAELSSFDITRDLTMKVSPAVIHDNKRYARGSGINGCSYGLQCSLNF